jgi:cytochrome c5
VDTAASQVCFEDHVVPILKRDCSACHENGEYGIRLRGEAADFEAIYPTWVSVEVPAESLLLKVAALGRAIPGAGNDHPVIWPADSEEYATVLAWVREGALLRANCGDWGQCETADDCNPVDTCFCPDGSFPSGRVCAIEPATGEGTCAQATTCTEPRFGLCAVPPDTDIHEPEDVSIPDEAGSTELADVAALDLPAEAVPEAIEETKVELEVAAEVVENQVSFSGQITPLHKKDCSSCHFAGQYKVKITGTVQDYDTVMKYVSVGSPETSAWNWASGKGAHPAIWPKSRSKFELFVTWIEQGAKNN